MKNVGIEQLQTYGKDYLFRLHKKILITNDILDNSLAYRT